MNNSAVSFVDTSPYQMIVDDVRGGIRIAHLISASRYIILKDPDTPVQCANSGDSLFTKFEIQVWEFAHPRNKLICTYLLPPIRQNWAPNFVRMKVSSLAGSVPRSGRRSTFQPAYPFIAGEDVQLAIIDFMVQGERETDYRYFSLVIDSKVFFNTPIHETVIDWEHWGEKHTRAFSQYDEKFRIRSSIFSRRIFVYENLEGNISMKKDTRLYDFNPLKVRRLATMQRKQGFNNPRLTIVVKPSKLDIGCFPSPLVTSLPYTITDNNFTRVPLFPVDPCLANESQDMICSYS